VCGRRISERRNGISANMFTPSTSKEGCNISVLKIMENFFDLKKKKVK
jgi:hypothetical protein